MRRLQSLLAASLILIASLIPSRADPFPDDTFGNAIFAQGRGTNLNLTASSLVKGSGGRVVRVIVNTTTAVAAITINDAATVAGASASNVVHTIPVGATAGTIYLLDWPCFNGIVVNFSTGTGALAISFE